MSNLPFVSICVSSYNRGDIIEKCIHSLIELNYENENYEIIIIDNNSQDKTCEIINNLIKKNKVNFLNLKLVDSSDNLGSSGSFIEALKFVNTSWNFILKMDEDVILDKNCLIEMIKMNQKIAIKGIIGGKILYYKNKKIIQAIGSKLHPFYAIAKGIGINNNDDMKVFDKPMSIDAPNGCMILIPREVYEKVSWFYKDYFMYYDDHEIFVLPSFTEGHPMVLLEALARRRPVIIFEEIEHVIGDKKGIFVAKRNFLNFFGTLNHIKKNYKKI